MSFNLLAGALSAVILQSRGVARDKVIGGAAVSALTPGLLGLAIPLAVASQFGQKSDAPPPGGTGSGSNSGGVTDLFTMPDVVGMDKISAIQNVTRIKQTVTLIAAELRCFDSDKPPNPGTVLLQKPEAGRMVAEGDAVTLYVQPDVSANLV
jgi:hypothetical protein